MAKLRNIVRTVDGKYCLAVLEPKTKIHPAIPKVYASDGAPASKIPVETVENFWNGPKV